MKRENKMERERKLEEKKGGGSGNKKGERKKEKGEKKREKEKGKRKEKRKWEKKKAKQRRKLKWEEKREKQKMVWGSNPSQDKKEQKINGSKVSGFFWKVRSGYKNEKECIRKNSLEDQAPFFNLKY